MAHILMDGLIYLARLPVQESSIIVTDSIHKAVLDAPAADLNMFPLHDRNVQKLWKLRDATGTTCVFCMDGGLESAIA